MVERSVIRLKGIVQGIGFRPFVHRIAVHHQLTGFVQNRGDLGVLIIVEGSSTAIDNFLSSLHLELEIPSQFF